MKTFLSLIIIFLLGITKQINSQEINPLDFYPYHVGDVWQYLEFPSGTFSSGEITRIDTINQFTHLIYYGNNETAFVKILSDSAIVLVDPSMWIPYYKLNYPVGSIWIRDTTTSWWVHFKTEYMSEVFSQFREMREYYIYEYIPPGDTNGLPGSVEYLVRGIGRYRITWEGGERILNGCIVGGVQYGTIVDVTEENEKSQPNIFILNNYPNPFNGQTIVHYFLPISSNISVTIYDILGKEIEQLYNGKESAGHHYKSWIPGDESSGIYIYQLRAGQFIKSNKMVLMK